MANIQHTYSGVGDPNNNPELQLTGDAIGLHFYLDTEEGSLWFSAFYVSFGDKIHAGWQELAFAAP